MLPAGTTEETAAENRRKFARQLGFASIAMPKLKHGHAIYVLEEGYEYARRPEADAIITDRPGQLIGVAMADCIGEVLCDPVQKVVAAIHSGWRGTAANIVGTVVSTLSSAYASRPDDLLAYVSPAPQRSEYEVGREVAELFDAQFSTPIGDGKYWFDNKQAVQAQLFGSGLRAEHVEVSTLSSYEAQFHSYRRDGAASGRHVVVIGLR